MSPDGGPTLHSEVSMGAWGLDRVVPPRRARRGDRRRSRSVRGDGWRAGGCLALVIIHLLPWFPRLELATTSTSIDDAPPSASIAAASVESCCAFEPPPEVTYRCAGRGCGCRSAADCAERCCCGPGPATTPGDAPPGVRIGTGSCGGSSPALVLRCPPPLLGPGASSFAERDTSTGFPLPAATTPAGIDRDAPLPPPPRPDRTA